MEVDDADWAFDPDFPDIPLFGSGGPVDAPYEYADIEEHLRAIDFEQSRDDRATANGARPDDLVSGRPAEDDGRSVGEGPSRDSNGPRPTADDLERDRARNLQIVRRRVSRAAAGADQGRDDPGEDGGDEGPGDGGLRPVRELRSNIDTRNLVSKYLADARKSKRGTVGSAVVELKEFEKAEFFCSLYAMKYNSSGAVLLTFMAPREQADAANELRNAYGRMLSVKVTNYDVD